MGGERPDDLSSHPQPQAAPPQSEGDLDPWVAGLEFRVTGLRVWNVGLGFRVSERVLFALGSVSGFSKGSELLLGHISLCLHHP
ncbi:unnamed protein product [Symbiodinium sp. CCMP2592]|nr:unnamed protein product [Symbiodinium sp. CCMP2592]